MPQHCGITGSMLSFVAFLIILHLKPKKIGVKCPNRALSYALSYDFFHGLKVSLSQSQVNIHTNAVCQSCKSENSLCSFM